MGKRSTSITMGGDLEDRIDALVCKMVEEGNTREELDEDKWRTLKELTASRMEIARSEYSRVPRMLRAYRAYVGAHKIKWTENLQALDLAESPAHRHNRLRLLRLWKADLGIHGRLACNLLRLHEILTKFDRELNAIGANVNPRDFLADCPQELQDELLAELFAARSHHISHALDGGN